MTKCWCQCAYAHARHCLCAPLRLLPKVSSSPTLRPPSHPRHAPSLPFSQLASGLNKEYAPISGVDDFVKKARAFALGKSSPAITDDRIASVQSLSGTGACRVIGDFYAKFVGQNAPFYLPAPSWGNHANIFKAAGLDVRTYRYYDPKTLGLDFDGMCEDLAAAPDGSIVLLHACAHNPTGIDPTEAQWRELCSKIKSRGDGLSVFFDSAYQGFASGDAEKDAFSIRHFVDEGVPFALAQSFAKNFGLYGERVGVLSMVCADTDEATRVLSQLKILVRAMYSNPPVHGARIVATVLGDAELEAQWRGECKLMADRIIDMRAALKKAILAAGSTKDWSHVTDQIGMFCYTGLNKEQVGRLRDEFHVYITGDGRVSMAGVTTGNVDYIANAIHTVSQ